MNVSLGRSPERRARRTGSGALPACLAGLLSLLTSLMPLRTAEAQAVASPASQTPASQTPASFATTESAEYSARIDGQSLVNGTARFVVTRHGQQPTLLDWTGTNLACTRFAWKEQPVINGTTSDQRQVILTDRDRDELTVAWSLRGEMIGQTLIFDLQLPAALNSRLQLDIPRTWQLTCDQGLLVPDKPAPESDTRRWIIELGDVSKTTIRARTGEPIAETQSVRYEVETEFRARRDGMFIRTDLTIEAGSSWDQQLELIIPPGEEIQSITLTTGTLAPGAAVQYQRVAGFPNRIQLQLNDRPVEPRMQLRIRAFEPATWGAQRTISHLQLMNGLETRSSLVLRIEPPLQLVSIEPGNHLTTGLSSDDTSGETWRFEAREPHAMMNITIDEPSAVYSLNVSCLADLRAEAGWIASTLTMQAENGTSFGTALQLPEDWHVISVTTPDNEARLSSWHMHRNVLHLSWQNPFTRGVSRQVRLFGRTGPRKEQVPLRLMVPRFNSSGTVTAAYQLIVPASMDVQLLESEGWRLSGRTDILPELSQFREVSERLIPALGQARCVTFKTTELQAGQPLVSLSPIAASPPRTSDVPATADQPDVSAEKTATEKAAPETATPGKTATSDSNTPQEMQLSLLTVAGQTNHRECVHHALLTFNPPVMLSQLDLHLAEQGRLSAVKIDDQPVMVLREGNAIAFQPEQTTARSLSLTYVTMSESRRFDQFDSIPLPTCHFPVSAFKWSLDLPEQQRLSRVELPGILDFGPHWSAGSKRLFGPISRSGQDTMFNPFSRQDWKELFQGGTTGRQVPGQRRTWEILAPTAGAVASFHSWETLTMRRYAWSTLLGCLLIGSIMRRLQSGWLRRISIVWFAALVFLIALLPESQAMILGGALAGSLLSLAVPRRWILRRDFLSSGMARPLKPVATAGLFWGLVTLSAVPWSLLPFAQAADPPVRTGPKTPAPTTAAPKTAAPMTSGPITALALPGILIRSARYEIIRDQPIPEIRARFEILRRHGAAETYLRLPMQNIVFSHEARCELDNQPATMIPSIDGNAMLIPLPDEQEGTSLEDDWQLHQLAVSFSLRPLESLESSSPELNGTVPAVLNSTLEVPAGMLARNWRRNGAMLLLPGGREEYQLGALGVLGVQVPRPVSLDAAISAQSQIDLSSLRIRCQTRILPGATPWPAQLPLTLPAGSLLTAVHGGQVIDWIPTPAAEAPSRWTIRLRPESTPSPIQLNYEFHANSSSPASLTLPAIPLWGGSQVNHRIGFSGPAFSTMSIPVQSGILPLSPEEFQTGQDTPRMRTLLAVQLTSPLPIHLNWGWIRPRRTAQISETMTTMRDGIHYSAQLQMTVAEVPTFRHQLLLAPQYQLDSVTTGPAGNETGIRFTQMGRQVTLFLPGGQLGERTFRFKGISRENVESWNPVPVLDPVETTVTDRVLTINDDTGWNLEWERAGTDEPPHVLPAPASSTPRSRLVGTFRNGMPASPSRLRLTIPNHVYQAEAASLFKPAKNQDWELLTAFHVTTTDTPLRTVLLQVPPGWKQIRIRPTSFTSTQTSDDEGTRVAIRIPDRYSDQALFTVSAHMPAELRDQIIRLQEQPDRAAVKFPMIECLSAQKTAQYLLHSPDFPAQINPQAVGRVTAMSIPGWLPEDWEQGIVNENLDAFVLRRPDLLLLPRAPARSMQVRPRLHLFETVVWPLESGALSGVSQVWVSTNGATLLPLTHGNELEVQTVNHVGSGALKILHTPTGTNIELPGTDTLAVMNIHWLIPRPGQKVRLFELHSAEPVPNLLALVRTGQQVLQTRENGTPVSDVRAWLTRWEALLNCANQVAVTSTEQAILFDQIRQCRQMVSEALTDRPATAPAVLRMQQLNQEWDDVQARADHGETSTDPVTGATTVAMTNATALKSTGTLFEMLSQSTPAMSVDWVQVDNGNWTGNLIPSRPATDWRVLAGVAVLILCVCGMIWRLRHLIGRLRERASHHPSASFACLGAIWWWWFSPSAFGLLLLLTALTVSLIAWGLRRVLTLPAPAADSTR